MKVLIVDNNIDRDSWGADELRVCVKKSGALEVYTRRAPQMDLPLNARGFDAVVVSGSKTSCLAKEPWTDKLDEFIKTVLNDKIPYLGVCYGHQSLVRVMNGREALGKSSIPEIGWTEIKVTENKNFLLQGLPQKFYTFSSHNEETKAVPNGMKKFCESKDCSIQGIFHEKEMIFGIQFHPERNFERGEKRLSTLIKEKKTVGLLNAGKGKKLYNPDVSEKIFGNFFNLIRTGKK